MGIYTEIFEKNRYDLHSAVSKSRSWFSQQQRILAGQNITAQRLLRSEPQRNVTNIIPGELYLFRYDPKLKDTLPYWDMFPLTFPFRKLADGFLALNMHYLPYPLRIRLLDRLMEFKTNSKMNEHTRIKYSWALIDGVSKFDLARNCVHRYLGDHVQSPFRKIDAADWATAMMLPVEQFVGAKKQTVWAKTIR